MNILHSSEHSQWFTDPTVIELVHEMLGGPIDLDPASCFAANRIVKAARFYGQQCANRNSSAATFIDAFAEPKWEADRFFMNPPYSVHDGGPVARWIRRAMDEYACANIHEGVILLNATPDRTWFRQLWQYDLCFLDKRVRFWTYDENGDLEQGPSPTHGNVLVFLGSDNGAFVRHGMKYGTVIEAGKAMRR